MDDIDIKIVDGEVFLNGENVSNEIRGDLVTKNVSWVSANQKVREKLVSLQRDIAKDTSFVLDGRDIGTVVFPDAKYKFFLTASPKVRAIRRFEQNESSLSVDELEESIIARDKYDSSRKTSPLKKAQDAILIDNSNMTIDETLEAIISKVDSPYAI
ncbi:putative cytidylate kinase [Anaerococcus prevotii ACS-065-V-Col13]|uniref:(d)CMP kinase n=1 Tax=Anaerococcus prevotii ACS-065-V-Col13 TaxID=879305 RepID=F0GUJ7_9FIRM|nr:(d)CMP kinase [Anaerococcus prevotii]EGC82432.1 putative cytidylate kinase [Anaerococcus prevotii ACS-065-V-Col13]